MQGSTDWNGNELLLPTATETSVGSKGITPRPVLYAGEALCIYQGDALELLKKCPAETFDLVFADPPYFWMK